MFKAPDGDISPAKGGFKAPETDSPAPPGYWSDVGRNALKEVGNMIPSPEDALENAKNMWALTSIPSGGVPSLDDLKQMKKMGMEAPGQIVGMAKNLGGSLYRTATNPSQEFRERPVSTALNVASVVAPMLNKLRGPAATVGEYAGRMGENQMGKLHGASQAQFRQMGRDYFGDAMRSSYKMGDADMGLGSIGREQMIKERIGQLGQELGDIRAQANAAGPKMTPQQMRKAIEGRVASDFAPGGKYFDESSNFNKQLQNIEKMPEGGIENFAERVTDLRQNAKTNSMRLPVNAETNIAKEMAAINDAEIAKRLPQQAEQYGMLKDEFRNAKSLDPMELRGEAKEALGGASNTLFGTAKNIGHTLIGGPKLGAHLGFGAEAALKGFANSAGLPSEMIGAVNLADKVPGQQGAIIGHVETNPALSQWRDLFQQAMQRGQQAVTAVHYTLMQKDPDYNKTFTESQNVGLSDPNYNKSFSETIGEKSPRHYIKGR